QRADVAIDAPAICHQRARRLRTFHPGEQPACGGIRQVGVTEFANRARRPLCLLVGRRVLPLGDTPEQPNGLLTGGMGCPGRAMTANRVAALAAFLCSVEQDVGDGVTTLPPSTEASHCSIPDLRTRAQ